MLREQKYLIKEIAFACGFLSVAQFCTKYSENTGISPKQMQKKMLENGPYPYFLKQRVASSRGHLENLDSARMIAYLAIEGKTKSFMLAHLSDKNNTPSKALETVSAYLESKSIGVTLCVAERYAPSLLVAE